MSSAFISYSHSDREFVLALIERLQDQGLDVRYDQVALQIGDSLIQTLSREIAEGDFLIAVVSPDSVRSDWCQKEVALAMTQGIDERRVKVLPIRYRSAPMPPMLHDTFWADADADDVETLARRLSAAMTAQLEDRDADVPREAAQVESAGRLPPHAEVVGDAAVAQIEEVAQRVWDLVEAWASVWDGRGANLTDLRDPQRRLRWAFENLPDYVRDGLPLVGRLASADEDYFASGEPDWSGIEADFRAELLSVRTQVAQGLPVTRRWTVDDYLGTMPNRRDAVLHLWQIRRGDETERVEVFITGSAIASTEGLPAEVVEAKMTDGRSVITSLLTLDEPPPSVMVSTAGVRWPVED